ncbi:LysM peptidoglycan-binding domain-containing protein [Alkalibacterium thalassium]|uniref:LysM repeat-containing protein n=1 Tax=Alkalibacterium thalassium TaxID=426701 RepID=A0A1G9ALY7_9LACT|nr:LysM peptidoglycan-binding domain-containing protein [Alkalibacterium thalassium]SDK28308.1 LysM repeat-containing protein [Alkalibacterium thalassium]
MSKKDRESMEELWSKRFDEEVDYTDDEPMSRKAKREREQSISPILTVTVIFLALLIILPISAYAWFSNREDMSEDPSSPSVEQSLAVNDEEEPDEEEPEGEDEEPDGEENEPGPEVDPEEESEPDEEPESVQTPPVTEQPSAPEPEPEPEPEPQPEPQPEPAGQGEYYTVKAGDNMYRIALNHGMSTEELMQLNGLTVETVFVGQELRVE